MLVGLDGDACEGWLPLLAYTSGGSRRRSGKSLWMRFGIVKVKRDS